jgi:hypothetical protein
MEGEGRVVPLDDPGADPLLLFKLERRLEQIGMQLLIPGEVARESGMMSPANPI